jgi:hypothetical protein
MLASTREIAQSCVASREIVLIQLLIEYHRNHNNSCKTNPIIFSYFKCLKRSGCPQFQADGRAADPQRTAATIGLE